MPDMNELTIEQINQYIKDLALNEGNQNMIRDLISIEMEKLYEELNPDFFKTNYKENQICIQKFDEIMKPVISNFSNLIISDKVSYREIISDTIEQLAKKQPKNTYFPDLPRYPTLLLIYAIGIVAVKSENYEDLAGLLLDSHYYGCGESGSIPQFFNINSPDLKKFHKNSLYFDDNNKDSKTPLSDHLCSVLFEQLKDHFPDKDQYEVFFNLFEYLYGIIYVDLLNPNLSNKPLLAFYGRSYPYYKDNENNSKVTIKIETEIDDWISQGDNWGLLKVGFFKKSIERFKNCKTAYDKSLA